MDRSHSYMHMLHSKSRIDSHKLHTKVCTHKLFNRAYDYKKGKQTYGYKIWNKQYHQAEFRPNKRIKLQDIVADIISSITIHQYTKTNREQSVHTVLVEFMIHNKDDSIRFEPSDDKHPCHIDTLSSSKLLVQTNNDIYVLVFLEQGDNTIVRQQLSKQDIFTCVVNMLATPMYPNSLEQLELYKAVQELALSARNEFSFTLKESVTEKAFSREETRVMTGVYLYLFQQRFTYLYRNRKIKIDTAYLKQCIQDDRLLLSLLFPGGLNKKDKALIGAMATLSTNLVILLSEFYNLFGKNVFSLDVNNLDDYPMSNKLYCMDNIQVATLPITQSLTVVLPSTGGVVHSAKQHCFNEVGYKDTTTNHITFVKPELLAIVRMSDLVTKDNMLEIDEYFTFVSSKNRIIVQSVMKEIDHIHGNRYALALLDREAQSRIRYYKVTSEEVSSLNTPGHNQHTLAILDEKVQSKLIFYRVIPEIASVLEVTQYKDRYSLDLLNKDEEGIVKFHKVSSEVVAKMPININNNRTTIAVLESGRQEILRYHQIKPHQVIDMSNLTTYDITYSIVLLDKEAQDVFNTILMIINQAADNHIYHSFKQYIKQVLQDNGIMILDDTIADIMDLFIFYFKHEFIDSLNQSRDRKHFSLHPRGKVDESELYTIELGDVLLSNVKGESVVLKVDSNLSPVSLHTHKKRVCLVELDVLFCSAIESFYQMVDRGKIILVEQVAEQFNNPPILLRSVPRLFNVYSRITARLLNGIYARITEAILLDLNYGKVDIEDIQSLVHVSEEASLIDDINTHQIISDDGPYGGESKYSVILRDNTVYAKTLFNEIKEMLIIPYIMPIYVSEFGTQEQYANTILRLKNLYIYKLIIDILNPPEIILIPIAMLSLTLIRSLFERICIGKKNIVITYYEKFWSNICEIVNSYNGCMKDYSYSTTKEARDKLYQFILALIINLLKFKIDTSKVYTRYDSQLNQFELFCKCAWWYYEKHKNNTWEAIHKAVKGN